jgi:Mitochondrial carrier protein
MPSYTWMQRRLGNALGERELWGARHVLAGAFAGFVASSVKAPVDLIKKRCQAGLYPNVFAAVLAVASDAKGAGPVPVLAAFYAGWTSSVAYDVPYNAVQFIILENIKRLHRRQLAKTADRRKRGGAPDASSKALPLSPRANMVIGAATGALTSLATEPFDVVKTRMMTQLRLNTGVTLYTSWPHCARTIFREEGVTAFWKGSVPRLVWVAGSGAIWYSTYATVAQLLARRQREKRLRNQPQRDNGRDSLTR